MSKSYKIYRNLWNTIPGTIGKLEWLPWNSICSRFCEKGQYDRVLEARQTTSQTTDQDSILITAAGLTGYLKKSLLTAQVHDIQLNQNWTIKF